MDTFITKAEAALLLPETLPPSRRLKDAEAMRLAAIAARDAAVVEKFRAVARLAGRCLGALRSLPARFSTYQALSTLSDRELRDIGMTRFDIGRVFDAGFDPRPANDSGERPTPRAA